MIDSKLRAELEALLRLAAEASPLPWDNSRWYSLAYVKDNTNPDWNASDEIKPGQCTYCVDHPETYVKTVTSKSGRNMHLHVFPLHGNEPDRIFSTVTGFYVLQCDSGEIERADSSYIVAACNLAPQLARLVLEQEAEAQVPVLSQEAKDYIKAMVANTAIMGKGDNFIDLTPEQESRIADVVARRVMFAFGLQRMEE